MTVKVCESATSAIRYARLLLLVIPLIISCAALSGCKDPESGTQSIQPEQGTGSPTPLASRPRALPETSSEDEPLRPLLAAAERGQLDELKRLLNESGQDINSVDSFGYTPLHAAAEGGQLECVSWLLDNGADPNILSVTNTTAIHLAIEGGHEECVHLLIDSGTDVNASSDKGWTPLMQAVRSSPPIPQVVAALIEAGADVNAKGGNNRFGGTVLMLAAPESPEVIEMLLEAGADPTLRNDRRQNALQHAVAQAKLFETTALGFQESDAWRHKLELMQDALEQSPEGGP